MHIYAYICKFVTPQHLAESLWRYPMYVVEVWPLGLDNLLGVYLWRRLTAPLSAASVLFSSFYFQERWTMGYILIERSVVSQSLMHA